MKGGTFTISNGGGFGGLAPACAPDGENHVRFADALAGVVKKHTKAPKPPAGPAPAPPAPANPEPAPQPAPPDPAPAPAG